MVATNGKQTHAVCLYCKKGFDPIRSTQITCGGEECKKKHREHLTKNPASKRDEAPAKAKERTLTPQEWGDRNPAAIAPKKSSAASVGQGEGVQQGVQQAPPAAGLPVAPTLLEAEPVVAKSYGLTVDQLDEAMDRATGCPILAAVLALEAVPREKHNAIMDVLEARHQAKLAAARAEGLLQALGVQP